jgi:hypothetical protein
MVNTIHKRPLVHVVSVDRDRQILYRAVDSTLTSNFNKRTAPMAYGCPQMYAGKGLDDASLFRETP